MTNYLLLFKSEIQNAKCFCSQQLSRMKSVQAWSPEETLTQVCFQFQAFLPTLNFSNFIDEY